MLVKCWFLLRYPTLLMDLNLFSQVSSYRLLIHIPSFVILRKYIVTDLLKISWFTPSVSGVIRGSGQQKIGAYVNLGAFYLIGIPTGLVFAFGLHIGGKVAARSPYCFIIFDGNAILVSTNLNMFFAGSLDRNCPRGICASTKSCNHSHMHRLG